MFVGAVDKWKKSPIGVHAPAVLSYLYVGDVIKDSRTFCRKKAGRIFAIQEADAEWPNDRDLIGRGSAIPYTPRIDRGRWNCRHRIRYITEEMAEKIDPAKVARIKQKYGS